MTATKIAGRMNLITISGTPCMGLQLVKKQCGLMILLFLLFSIVAKASDDHIVQKNTYRISPAKIALKIDTLYVTWTGITSTAWSTGSNWSGGMVPNENDDVIIPAGTPFSPIIPNGTIGYCNSIQVKTGASFTVASGGALNIKSSIAAVGTASLITAEATLVTNTSAQLGGTITDTGACAITAHGIVISKFNNPTTDDATYTDLAITGTGTFSLVVSMLQPTTTYYVRAYATNCKGTSYGNEIKFTTGGATNMIDTGYFRLTTGGVIYFSYDLSDPKSATVFPEGDTRKAYVTVDIINRVFNISSQSSFISDPAASFGYSFSYINPDVTGTGIYSFRKYNSSFDKDILMTIRTGPGAPDPVNSSGYNTYENVGNFARHEDNFDCVSTELTSEINTLVISRWGNPGQFIEGTITGTLYENYKTAFKCINSTSKTFSVEFKLKRL